MIRKVLISKRNGKFREIYIIDNELKNELRSISSRLQKLNGFDKDSVVHGFVKKRNAITNAFQHIGYRYTLSFDMESFFDTITIDKANNLLPKEIIDKAFIEGAIRQGLPSSPVIANIVFNPIDKLILQIFNLRNIEACYTRYADDLTFSFNDISDKSKIEEIINTIIPLMGYTLNKTKTKFQSSTNGKRIITGVAVDNNSVTPTRKTKRKLRAAKHNFESNKNYHRLMKYKGLLEWSLCKHPNKKDILDRESKSASYNFENCEYFDSRNSNDDNKYGFSGIRTNEDGEDIFYVDGEEWCPLGNIE